MSYVNWQDPGTREIRSTDISGLQEIVSKLERSVGMETVSETDIPLTEVYISENDRWRIFQAPEGKRNWVSEPAPVIKRDGVPIDIGFVIDYGAGAIILATNDTKKHTYTADATYIKSLQTSLNEELATHLAEDVTQGDNPHGLIYEEGTWTPIYVPQSGAFDTIAYAKNLGRYIRIGNVVTIWGIIRTANIIKGDAGGNLYIRGLPFIPRNWIGVLEGNSLNIGSATRFANDVTITGGNVLANGNIELYKHPSSLAKEVLTVNDLRYEANNFYNFIDFTATYLI